MARQKFKFNHHKMDFSPVRLSALKVLLIVLKYLVISLLLAVLYYFIFALIYDTKEERGLAAENRYLREQYSEARRRIDLLDNTVENIRLKDMAIYREVFNSELPNYVLQNAGQGPDCSRLYDEGEDVLIAEMVRITGAASQKAAAVTRNLDDILKILQKKEIDQSGIPSMVPVRNFSIGRTGASVGEKFNPFLKTLKYHEGIDLLAPVGTDVLAPADGRVKSVTKGRGDGTCVTIEHFGGITTEYKHLGSVMVYPGQSVRRGTPVARIGSSGRSFAPHLHYEVRKNGRVMDPVNFFFHDLGPLAANDVAILGLITGQSLD